MKEEKDTVTEPKYELEQDDYISIRAFLYW